MPDRVGQCEGRGAEGVKASWAVDSLLAVTSSCLFIYLHLELILQVALEARDITRNT